MKDHNKIWAIIIGTGVSISPIHNKFLTDLTTNADGQTWLFIPAIGYLLTIMGSGLFLLNNWERVKKAGIGSKSIYIPLFILAVCISVSGVTGDTFSDKVAPLGAALSFLALYYSVRIIGKDVFLPLAIGSAIASFGVIGYSVFNPGILTGGYIFEYNYDIVVGYVLLGTALCFNGRYQWILASLSLTAMFLTGSPEAVFAIGVAGATILIRRDWSRKLVMAVMPAVYIIAIVFIAGYGTQLYSYVTDVISNKATVLEYKVEEAAVLQEEAMLEGKTGYIIEDKDNPDYERESAIGRRVSVIKHAMVNITPLGDGFNLTAFRKDTVHNVPLIIVQQLGWFGIPAALCWLWVSIWCLFKTKLKYVWVLVLALSVWDHYIWTQLAPVWWMAIGITTTINIKKDYIFRGRDENTSIV